jgi:hypothetical protein
MQKFEYRTPRFSVDLPVQFIVDDLTFLGRCREISQEGMTLELREPLTTNTSGRASLTYREQVVEVRARVAHATESHAGLEFQYDSDAERGAVAHLIASLTTAQSRPGPVLLN